MRIVGGKFKGRKFNPPAGKWPTRPTTDFAKEGLFNVLTNSYDFENIKVLDLFGGTGSISYEFVSRGCLQVTYVDKYYPCLAFVKKTMTILDLEEEIKIIKADVFKYIQKTTEKYDLIFADPPYALPRLKEIPDLVFQNELLEKEGLLIVEHDNKTDFESHLHLTKVKKYGNNRFSFFENK